MNAKKTFKIPETLVFVDLETTGFKFEDDRIIEVGIIVVKKNKILLEYEQLINPEIEIPPNSTRVSGITNDDVKNRPVFKDVQDEIMHIIKKGLFIAHNAKFDYGFLEAEYRKLDIPFSLPSLCTVELSKTLYPSYERHNLDSIMNRFDLKIKNRHRALDDILVTWEFYKKTMRRFDKAKIETTLKKLIIPAPPVKLGSSKSQIGLI